jgi:hypothetical protein
MSFGIKALKKEKNPLGQQRSKSYRQHIVLGDDVWAIRLTLDLAQKWGLENTVLISEKPLTKKVLLENHQAQLSFVRSVEKYQDFCLAYPAAKAQAYAHVPRFYKDGSWHEFGGRTKPLPLRDCEQPFVGPRWDWNLESLFSVEEWERLDSFLECTQQVRLLAKCCKKDPTDLEQVNNWSLVFKDLAEIECEQLWLTSHPAKLLKVSDAGTSLPERVAKDCAQVKTYAAVSLGLMLKNFSLEAGTYFVPQSQTHDWGYFIVDVCESIQEMDSHTLQHIKAFAYILEDEITAETMGEKIKLMKRTLRRLWPVMDEKVCGEFILAETEAVYDLSDLSGVEHNQSFSVSDSPVFHFAGRLNQSHSWLQLVNSKKQTQFTQTPAEALSLT